MLNNLLLFLALLLSVAVIKIQSLAIAIPLCFTLVAIVCVHYVSNKEQEKEDAVSIKLISLEAELKQIKSSISLKNL